MEPGAHQKRRIRQRARQFAERWGSRQRLTESKDSETFIDEFFGIFGIDCFGRNIIFEYRLPSGRRIDVFWPGVILIENKSLSSQSFSEAFEQATRYYEELEDYYKPKYILVNNFHHFEIRSFRKGQGGRRNYWSSKKFSLNELPESRNISLFYYLFDHKYEKITEKPVREAVHRTRCGILKLALASVLSLTCGYIISDGQPRKTLDNLNGGPQKTSTSLSQQG